MEEENTKIHKERLGELEKEGIRSMKESEIAWNEFFKDKPKPKNEEEDKKQQEEFFYWYNYVRKQSDTGKTPAEMYKEIYGEEPKNVFDEKRPSRFMNFNWDEDYNEDGFDEKEEDELDDAQEEAVVIATEIFEDSWKQIKKEVDGQSKKESCKYSFILGFLDYMKMMDKKSELIEKQMQNMSEEDIKKMIDKFKEYGKKEDE